MKSLRLIATAVAALALSSCGYHLGGMKPANMKDMNTFCVEVFENETLYPNAGMLMTTAMANSLQSDGTYRMAPRKDADFIVKGKVCRISRESLITDSEDTYVSVKRGLTVNVNYKVIDRKSGKELYDSCVAETSSFFNQIGSTESAVEAALSYATRRIADEITNELISE